MKSDQNGNIVISRILVGGAADKCGMLAAGDIIHQINGEEINGYSIDNVADLMVCLLCYNEFYNNIALTLIQL